MFNETGFDKMTFGIWFYIYFWFLSMRDIAFKEVPHYMSFALILLASISTVSNPGLAIALGILFFIVSWYSIEKWEYNIGGADVLALTSCVVYMGFNVAFWMLFTFLLSVQLVYVANVQKKFKKLEFPGLPLIFVALLFADILVL